MVTKIKAGFQVGAGGEKKGKGHKGILEGELKCYVSCLHSIKTH